MEISELNLQTFTQHWVKRTAARKVLSSTADLAATLSSKSYAKPKFLWPQNHRNGKHSDAMIKDFGAYLDNTQDATHLVAIYIGMQEFIKNRSFDMMYILDEQLRAMEFCIYNGMRFKLRV